MLKLKLSTWLAIAALAASCAPSSSHHSDPSLVASKTTVETDRHRGGLKVKGPVTRSGVRGEWFIRGWADCEECARRYQLYAKYTFRDWRFLRRAYAEGRRYELVQIDREVIDANALSEHVAINLSESDVRSISSKGIEFLIEGQRGEVTIQVPAGYAAGVLNALDSP